jgi:hypothetical protein
MTILDLTSRLIASDTRHTWIGSRTRPANSHSFAANPQYLDTVGDVDNSHSRFFIGFFFIVLSLCIPHLSSRHFMVYHRRAHLAQGAQILRRNLLHAIFQFEETRAITAKQPLLAATTLEISV